MSDFELLAYKEIAARLGIKLASARQTVSRRGWRRVKANDGTVKIEVPNAYLQRETVGVDDGADIKIDVDSAVVIATLKAENGYLQSRIADLEQDRDRWHELATRPWWKRLSGG